MTSLRSPRFTAALAIAAAPLALCWPAAVVAQAMIQSLAPNDADALATQMRVLAASPQNLTALATAGELSLKLGDLSGAAALFARADKVDPRSGRVKAGMAAILVRSERPGEALRFFDQAASYGWTVDHFAADRGLAYDLIGENERAQRDYRLALLRGRDDETVRRYALSLGIAGRRAEALQQLDPLVRRQDRAAWRAQAFVLAMGGDTAGAAKIATAMMPAAMNQGLGAFFQRLPTLSRTDRAFAVHFGEIYPTPERLADARLAPSLVALAPEPAAIAPVQVAAVTAQPDRRSRRDRRRGTEVAATTAAAPVVQMASPREVVQVLPGRTALPAPAAASISAPVAVAAVTPTPVTSAAQAMRETDVRVVSTPTGAVTTQRPVAISSAPVQVAAQPIIVAPAPAYRSPPVTVAATTSTPTRVVAATPPLPASAPIASSASTDRADEVLARIVAGLSIPASELGVAPARPDPAPVPVPAAVERAPTSSAGKRVVAEASAKEARDGAVRRVVAARVTGNPDADEPAIPRTRAGRRAAARELALADTTTARTSRAGRRGAAVASDEPADDQPTRTGRRGAAIGDEPAGERSTRTGRRGAAVADEPAGERSTRTGRRGAAVADEPADERPVRTRNGRTRTAVVDEPLDPKAKRAADRKALADKKAAADKKALADKAAADKKATRANPARIWVQVAGGANEGDLGKAWSSVKAKTPALAGKSGYATPLRATNRVLTGPFKTDAEARSFVNQLGKQGVSAFSFTSDPGQEVKKLGGK